MPGSAIIESGNYDLQIATGFNVDAFVLDDPLKGVLAGYTTTTTRTNLVTNPNFETNTTGWILIGAGTTLSRITTDAYVGNACLQVSKGAVANGAASTATATAAQRIPVTAGITYTFSAWVKVPTGQPSCTLRLRTLEFQASGTQNAAQVSGTTTVTDTDGWVRLSFSDTPTAGATPTVTMAMRVEETSANAKVYLVDAVLVEEISSALPYFDGTYADTYTGYTLTSQQWNGTADASTSTATWGLTSSYIPSNYTLDGTTEFASVIDSTTNVTVKRGRRDIGDTFSAGTMTFIIQDVSGVFNPFDQESPYYDTAQSKPGLAPMREVHLIRYDADNLPEYLFSGFVVNYDYNFALGGLDTVTVYCADQFYLLSQTYLDELNVAPETSGERIETVLDLPEVDFPAGARNVATGTVNLGHDSHYTVPAGTNVLQYISQINDTAEFGRLFMSRAGVLTFQDRIGATLAEPTVKFRDDGTEYKYNGVGISFQADQVVNRAVVTGLNGNTATADDATSIATYFIQTTSITNSLLHEQTSIDDAADYLLNPEPEARYTSVETAFLMLTDAQKDNIATVDIGDTISIQKTFPSGAGTSQLVQVLSVEGVEHYLDFRSGHRVLYSTAPTTIVYRLILDDATYGTIDTTNVLG